MTTTQLVKNIKPYIRPYRWLVLLALILTLIGSLTAQVNALVLRYTVDEINTLIEAGKKLKTGVQY